MRASASLSVRPVAVTLYSMASATQSPASFLYTSTSKRMPGGSLARAIIRPLLGGIADGLLHARRRAAAALLEGARVALTRTAVDGATRTASPPARHRGRAPLLVVARRATAAARRRAAGADRAGRAARAGARESGLEGQLRRDVDALRGSSSHPARRGGTEPPPHPVRAPARRGGGRRVHHRRRREVRDGARRLHHHAADALARSRSRGNDARGVARRPRHPARPRLRRVMGLAHPTGAATDGDRGAGVSAAALAMAHDTPYAR